MSGLEHLGLDPWKCVIFRRLFCLLLFIAIVLGGSYVTLSHLTNRRK